MYDKGSLLAQIPIEGDKEHKDTSKGAAKDFHIDGAPCNRCQESRG